MNDFISNQYGSIQIKDIYVNLKKLNKDYISILLEIK